jgi:hypothetical protein
MRANEVTKMLGGSVAVYIVMAACSGGSGPQSATTGDGGGSSSGSMGDALTDPVPEAQADPNQSGTRLKVNYYAGADGSKQSAGSMHDSMRNEDCYFQNASDGTTRCMPTATHVDYYVDAACTQGLVLVSNCAGTVKPTYVAGAIGVPSTYPAPPAESAHLFQLGSTTTVTTPYLLSLNTAPPGACTQFVYTCTAVSTAVWMAATADSTVYGVGAEVPPSAFVQASMRTEP